MTVIHTKLAVQQECAHRDCHEVATVMVGEIVGYCGAHALEWYTQKRARE